MGVYIPNMEMPKRCIREIGDGLLDEPCIFLEYDLSCRLQPESNGYDYDETYKTCPLIEIDLVRCEECEWSNGECSVGERYQGGCTFGERRTNDNK